MSNEAPIKIDKTCKCCGKHYSEFPQKPRPQLDLDEKEIIAWFFDCGCKSTLLVKTENWKEANHEYFKRASS